MVKLGRPEGKCKNCGERLRFIQNMWVHARSRQRLCPQGKGVAEPK